MSARTTRTLDDRIQNARQCLALMHVTLAANVESIAQNKDGDPLLYHANRRAADLAVTALKDLDDIDLPRPIMSWQPGTSDEALLAALQEYGRPLRRVTKAAGVR